MQFFNDDTIPKYWFIAVFGIKLIVSIALTMIYTNYYTDRNTADIFKYFDDSKVMFNALKTNPIDYFKMLLGIQNDTPYFNITYYDKMRFWYSEYPTNIFSDSHTIIRFNAFVHLFSFGHFHVHNVFINFISLVGLTAIYKTAINYIKQSKKMVFYAIFFAPSVLFWGSGLLKEGIIFLGLGMLLLHMHQLSIKICWKSTLIVFLSIVLISYTKMYILAALFPAIVGLIIYKKGLKQNAFLAYIISFFIVLTSCFLLINAPLKFNPFHLIIAKQHDFISLLNEVSSNSSFIVHPLNSITDIFVQIPLALVNTFVRPFLSEINSLFMLMSTAENIDIIFIFMVALFFKKQSLNNGILFFCLTFAFSLYLLVGLTVPNFGAIARYKVPATPFLLLAAVLIIDIDKLKIKFPSLNRFL